jgi:hypothetical protein
MRTPRPYRSRIRPIRIEGDVAFVLLTKGYTAVIDATDVPLVQPHNWCAKLALHKDGTIRTVYAVANLRQPDDVFRTVRLHRLILGASESSFVDHKDGDGLLNTRDNLRICTASENQRNQKLSTVSTSGLKGVNKYKDRWRAQIRINGRRMILGQFTSKEEAAIAYDRAAEFYSGEFARTNQMLANLVPAHTMRSRSQANG